MLKFFKRWSGALLLIITFTAVFFIALKDTSVSEILRVLRSMDPRWEGMAFLFWALFVCSRGYTMKFYLSRQGVYVPSTAAAKASLIGLFYSGITPAATGGQPMQIYHLRKYNVPVSLSASGVMVKFIGFQSMLLLMAGAGMACNFRFIRETVGASFWLVVLGFVINAAIVLMVLLAMINRRFVLAASRMCLKLGRKLRLVRSPEAAERKFARQIEGYLESLATLRGRPLDLLAMFLLSGLQVGFYSGIMWALYHAFGLAMADFGQLFTLQLLLYQTVSFVPLPGASGAQEGLFALFLHTIVPVTCRIGMMFAWRFFTFYLTILFGAAVIIGDGIHSLRHKKGE